MKKFSLKRLPMAVAAAALTVSGSYAIAQHVPMVGGAPMYPTKTIVQNAAQAKNLTTLVAAVKAAGLAETLSGSGPFTVFAPTNAAFDKLPAGTVQTLLKPENKAKLTKILTYHVVPGRLTATTLAADAKAHGGKAMLKTVEGEDLTVSKGPSGWMLTDAQGHHANITMPDVMQSNGVVHVIDTVMMP
ncbi:fasciclin domain-containing protein [Stakelama sediminis]|uniref:Putative surface protein with fasciclin (FAS1) repeats n=1 Tax=Stakelama sediminis TaxID=463200 RepID=A0A840YX03_9SPHN|nr:fasciclin domain-containing protein [Stakelama sediminis]MBB5718079.1 putative surface protein with fasciclin (FAS1) repeats [Stakelama sediminis]